MTVHPICPRCKLECLELVDGGTACPWCSTSKRSLGRPFNPARWVLITDALNDRLKEVTAA